MPRLEAFTVEQGQSVGRVLRGELLQSALGEEEILRLGVERAPLEAQSCRGAVRPLCCWLVEHVHAVLGVPISDFERDGWWAGSCCCPPQVVLLAVDPDIVLARFEDACEVEP